MYTNFFDMCTNLYEKYPRLSVLQQYFLMISLFFAFLSETFNKFEKFRAFRIQALIFENGQRILLKSVNPLLNRWLLSLNYNWVYLNEQPWSKQSKRSVLSIEAILAKEKRRVKKTFKNRKYLHDTHRMKNDTNRKTCKDKQIV